MLDRKSGCNYSKNLPNLLRLSKRMYLLLKFPRSLSLPHNMAEGRSESSKTS